MMVCSMAMDGMSCRWYISTGLGHLAIQVHATYQHIPSYIPSGTLPFRSSSIMRKRSQSTMWRLLISLCTQAMHTCETRSTHGTCGTHGARCTSGTCGTHMYDAHLAHAHTAHGAARACVIGMASVQGPAPLAWLLSRAPIPPIAEGHCTYASCHSIFSVWTP